MWYRSESIGRICLLLAVVCGCALAGCGKTSEPDGSIPGSPTLEEMYRSAPPTPELRITDAVHMTMLEKNPEYLRESTGFRFEDDQFVMAEFVNAHVRDISALQGYPLFYLGLRENPVEDLSPLKGMELRELYLEQTQVKDLSPLTGMPLQTVYLSQTPVSDLTPLADCPIAYLNLLGTPVTDLTPLKKMPLDTLWLNETQVENLGPLETTPLVSLTLHKTPVRDISVLGRMPTLQRLHIGETEVTDLRPLKNLRLQRLIFTPAKITEGLEQIRAMESLRELDVELSEGPRLTPAEFWAKYDAGEFAAAK
ncbi:MAG TPA: leucine-rich repeat domain-containing protein [Planctomycetaceae bacterium]|nr:leucine-rich repeat domain-containing protein [Planctomycetaceae bacterium]